MDSDAHNPRTDAGELIGCITTMSQAQALRASTRAKNKLSVAALQAVFGLSTRSHILQTIAKMERIAVSGQSPSGSAGTPLTPLPAEEWQQIREGLDALLVQMDSLVEALAPEEAARSKQRQPVEATRHNIALLLRELDQNVLADLAPKRGARYGKIDPADEGQLADALAAMHRTVQDIKVGD